MFIIIHAGLSKRKQTETVTLQTLWMNPTFLRTTQPETRWWLRRLTGDRKNNLCDEVVCVNPRRGKQHFISSVFKNVLEDSSHPPQDHSRRVVSDGVSNTNSLKSAVRRKPGNIWTNTTCSVATRSQSVGSQIHNLHPIAASGPRHRHSDRLWLSRKMSAEHHNSFSLGERWNHTLRDVNLQQ